MKDLTKKILVGVLILAIIGGIFSLYNAPLEKPKEVGISALIDQIENEQIKSIIIEENQLEVVLNNDQKEIVRKESSESLSTLLKNYQISPEKTKKIKIEIKGKNELKFWLANLLPFLIPLLFVIGFLWFMMKQAQGVNSKAMSFGRSQARQFNPQNRPKVTFKNVAGVKEAKQELTEVVQFLKNPKKFLSLGAEIPKGLLLLGAPGTGKTLLAKAVAGEADVPFFNISGSEFVEMFVGVGASRVRDLFQKAKKNSPCIIFVDEIDAVGRQRGAGLGGSHDEREQTLNQILVEMDGFDPNTNVIVIAATNRPDVLDKALLRPGRFDRRVILDMPSIEDRKEILKVHSVKKPLEDDVNIQAIAERTPGFSGADLYNLLNEAAILTALNNRKKITQQDILLSIDKILLGPERKSHILSNQEKKITAYHEAGHALIAHQLPNTDPVRKVSIVARGPAAGFTLKLPSRDKRLHSRTEFIEELAVLLGGRMAEKFIFDEITTGAQNDLREATKLAKKIVSEYGMSEKLGMRTFGEKEELIFLGKELHQQKDYSEKSAEEIDKEIAQLIDQAAKTALKIIKEKKKQLEKIADSLLEKETLEAEQFEEILKDLEASEKTEQPADSEPLNE